MIDLWGELAYYTPIDLANLDNRESKLPDNIRNSIILYNKALESLKIGNEDIAIIELKKSVSMNPEFYEAMNLLGLCYKYINEHEKAAEIFKKVIAAESNGIRALKYLDMFSNESNEPISKSSQKEKKTAKSKKIVEREKKQPSLVDSIKIAGKRDVLKYLIGIALGAVLILSLSLVKIPSFKPENTPAESEEQTENKYAEQTDEYKLMYENLLNEYEGLQKDLETANATIGYYKSALKLWEAETLYAKKEYEACADMLVLLRAVEFKGQDKEKFDKMHEDVMKRAATAVYDEGRYLVNTKRNYEEGLKKLSKIELYKSDFERMDAVLYMIGKCYQQLNDSRNALAMYQKLLSQYPESSYVYWAEIRIKELTAVP